MWYKQFDRWCRSRRVHGHRSELIQVSCICICVMYFFIVPLLFHSSPSSTRNLRSWTTQQLASKCASQTTLLSLDCLQYFWVQAGCTVEGLDYPKPPNTFVKNIYQGAQGQSRFKSRQEAQDYCTSSGWTLCTKQQVIEGAKKDVLRPGNTHDLVNVCSSGWTSDQEQRGWYSASRLGENCGEPNTWNTWVRDESKDGTGSAHCCNHPIPPIATPQLSKTKIMSKFAEYADYSANKKVLWMLRNASSDPNEWITLNDRNGQTVEHGCEGPVSLMTGVRVIEFTWNVGTLKIHLDDGRADGWYTYFNAMDGTLWGEGPVLRKYFPSRCKGKRFEKCIRGETTEKSVMEIAATTYLLQYGNGGEKNEKSGKGSSR